MPIRRSQKKRNAEPRQKQNQRRLVIDPMVNPGSSAHRYQARSKADPTRPHHRMVTLAQSSPGDRSACAPQSKTATVMLGLAPSRCGGCHDAIPRKKNCPCPETYWAWDGWSVKRIVCWRPCGVELRGAHFSGVFSRHDDWCGIGYYLGIDTPPLAFQGPNGAPSKGSSGRKIDAAEFLSAAGTFLATLTAFVSVSYTHLTLPTNREV